MNRSNKLVILAAAALATGMATAKAQNPDYAAGDLVLFFQNPGGATGNDQTLYVNVGQTALDFRGAAAGVDVANDLNIINISSQLTAAFGANWATETTLYAGLAGVWGNAGSLNNTLLNGDPNRTLYVSQARTDVGTVGQANSTGYTIGGDTAMTTAANGMITQNNVLETTGTGLTLQAATSASQIDDQNPFTVPGVQGTAFGTFPGGVQQAGSASQFGNFGGLTGIEFALDLYRILAKTNAPGQTAGPLRVGTYEGTLVLDTLGNVSFVTTAVPEVSSALLVGSLGLAGLVRRRRE
jgi:hypothetical protein